MMKASILAIGTEITDGQITNSNAQWLSRKLQDLNIEVSLHLCAPDEPVLIQKTLQLAISQTDLIFISGGLGPTSDDITRNVLCDHLAVPLELSEKTWQEVQEKLGSRNVIVRPAHKQQCFFPKGAKILANAAGVAPGFYLEHQNKHLWALPGPPHEIESIWTHSVNQQLNDDFSSTRHLQLTTWLCLGAPESELANTAEAFFADFAFEKKLGYRLQVPYVEIKLWHPFKNTEAQKAVIAFTQMLGEFYVDTDLNAINQKIVQKLKAQSPVLINDASSSGALLTRLTQAFGSPLWEHQFQYHLAPENRLQTTKINTLQLTSHDQTWHCEWDNQIQKTNWDVSSPSNKKSKWREPFLIEKLILEWMKVL